VDGVATPLVGALSDRTTDARAVGKLRGRRHRWTFGMAILSAICLVLISQQVTVIGVLGLWALFSVFQNGQYASLSASIPDHVPVRQRATVAGWVGMPQALGLVIGVELVASVFTKQTAGYTFLAAAMLLFVLPFVFSTDDYPLSKADREPFSARQLIEAFKVDLRANPDFGWAWITRFLASLSISMGTLYLYYFLRDAVRSPIPPRA
jgi:MFS family permease